MYYELESTAERRTRRNNDIKTLYITADVTPGLSKPMILIKINSRSIYLLFQFCSQQQLFDEGT